MPITQDRMISLIRATREFEEAYAAQHRLTIGYAEQLLAGSISIQEFMDYIERLPFTTAPSIDAIRSLEREAIHFKHQASRNRSNARRIAEVRAGTRQLTGRPQSEFFSPRQPIEAKPRDPAIPAAEPTPRESRPSLVSTAEIIDDVKRELYNAEHDDMIAALRSGEFAKKAIDGILPEDEGDI